MSNVILEAKLVGKIEGNFYVPKYQRGYRWTESQVKTLLNDLWDNCSQETQNEYCLQPVVVRKRGVNDFELIDGQQRLTTILILLNYIKKEYIPRTEIKFTLEYETRGATASFLNNINEKDAHENIDFYHIFMANKCIEQWNHDTFNGDENAIGDAMFALRGYLFNKTKVIWYEVGDDEDPIELFTRLNIGRIQLTNAELIKALLLRAYNNENVDKEREERSFQWDSIEKELRSDNDELWYFLTTQKASNYPTRIEVLFDLMANKKNDEFEKYYTFFWFEDEIKAHGVKKIWEDIQKNFLQIKEWYADNILYHKIGYLISSEYKKMNEIFIQAKDKRKSAFIKELDQMIAESIDFKLKEDETYSDLDYNGDYAKISKLLLLFNVQSIINKGVYQRFPFSKYNTAEWSLEHINAQNSEGLKNAEIQLEWIKMHLDSVEAVSENGRYETLINEMKNILNTRQVGARGNFDELFNKVCDALSEDSNSEWVHTISNMALLAKNDNAALNNSTFDVKRNLIVNMDQRGAFIPYCTKMVFLKYYTPSNENQIHFWGQKDREAYLKAMEEVLTPYLSLINKHF